MLFQLEFCGSYTALPLTPSGFFAMAGSSGDIPSPGSYSIADVRQQTQWQAEMYKFKVSQLNELLRKKGIATKGVKAAKAEAVAWHYTRAEIHEWEKTKEKERPPPAEADANQCIDAKQRRIDEFF